MPRVEPGSDVSVRNYFKFEFDIDVRDEYERLKSIARVPTNKLRDRETLISFINEAGRNAVRARIIATKARRLRELFRVKYDREMRRLTRAATRQIQEWMDQHGIRKKQITNAMVLEEIASTKQFAEEYEALINEREELRAIRDTLEEFAKQWSERKGTLQSQLSALKQEREVVIGGRQP